MEKKSVKLIKISSKRNKVSHHNTAQIKELITYSMTIKRECYKQLHTHQSGISEEMETTSHLKPHSHQNIANSQNAGIPFLEDHATL